MALLSRPRKEVDDLKKDIVAAGGVVSSTFLECFGISEGHSS